MKLFGLLGILLVAVACGGLSETEVDQRIQQAIQTAIAEIPPAPTPTLTSERVIEFTQRNGSVLEITFDDLLASIRGVNGRVSELQRCVEDYR